MAVNTKTIVLPLETLLLKLEAGGFKIEVDTRISLNKVLKEFGINFTHRLQDLKQILCPLVVKNGIEQGRFNQIFDSFYSEALKDANKKPERTVEENVRSQHKEIKKENEKSKVLKGRFILFLGVILFFVLTVPFQYYIKETSITTNGVEGIFEPNFGENGSPPPDRNINMGNFWVILIMGISVALILIWLALNLKKKLFKIFKHKKVPSDKTGIGPPYFLPFPDQSRLIPLSPEFYDIADTMRQRCSGDVYWLDIPKSVTVSARAGGFPRLEFKQSSRPSEYLMLIDNQGIHNQQAKLFEYLVDSLEKEDIYIDRFFYHTDPRICWNKEFSDGLSLQHLHEKYPKHRLVVFGDGTYMVDPFEAKLKNWAEPSFEKWKERALVTPVAFTDWGYKEYFLNAGLFIVLPADTNGLLALVKAITSPEKPDIKSLKKQFEDATQRSSSDLDFDNINDFKGYFEGENHLFYWMCALAYFPKPYWELTLAIGKKLEEYFKDKKLINYANLLKLTRIKWLQTGDIPEEIREKLLNKLQENPEILELVDQAISEVLEKTDVPSDAFAYKEIKIFFKKKIIEGAKWIKFMSKWDVYIFIGLFLAYIPISSISGISENESIALPLFIIISLLNNILLLMPVICKKDSWSHKKCNKGFLKSGFLGDPQTGQTETKKEKWQA